MIGTLLIAVIGYGLAVFFGFLAACCGFRGVTGKWRSRDTGAMEAMAGNAAAAIVLAVITRWLIGGAF